MITWFDLFILYLVPETDFVMLLCYYYSILLLRGCEGGGFEVQVRCSKFVMNFCFGVLWGGAGDQHGLSRARDAVVPSGHG